MELNEWQAILFWEVVEWDVVVEFLKEQFNIKNELWLAKNVPDYE